MTEYIKLKGFINVKGFNDKGSLLKASLISTAALLSTIKTTFTKNYFCCQDLLCMKQVRNLLSASHNQSLYYLQF